MNFGVLFYVFGFILKFIQPFNSHMAVGLLPHMVGLPLQVHLIFLIRHLAQHQITGYPDKPEYLKSSNHPPLLCVIGMLSITNPSGGFYQQLHWDVSTLFLSYLSFDSFDCLLVCVG